MVRSCHTDARPFSDRAGQGWTGRRNGVLLASAEGEFDVFLTADQNLAYQQNLAGRRIRVVVVSTNDLRRPRAAATTIASTVDSVQPGEVRFTPIP